MFNPLQPQFQIRVFDGKRVNVETLKEIGASIGSDYIDIQSCVAYPVTYSEDENLLTKLDFTVNKHAEVLLYYFFIGQSVILYGGYYDKNGSGMRHIFSGTVTRIKTSFNNNGEVSFSVECMHPGFTKMGKDLKNFVYPDVNSPRTWARKENLSVEDIVRGIAKDNNYDIGEINLTTGVRKVSLDKVNIRYQKDMSDWKFLTQMAQDFGCSVWIATENGKDKLYFVSHEEAFKKQDDIHFLYPLKGIVTDIKDSEIQKFSDSSYNRPRILQDVTIDEDIASADAVSRVASYYDPKTGEYKEAIAVMESDKDGNSGKSKSNIGAGSTIGSVGTTGDIKYERGSNTTMTFYTLDESKVEYISQTDPELAESIRNNGPASLPWGDASNPRNAAYYYKAVRRYESYQSGDWGGGENTDTPTKDSPNTPGLTNTPKSTPGVFDKAFFGIKVSAKCNQDLDIHSHRTYRIRGILSYYSKDSESLFLLKGLRHVWDSDGNWTELEFIR